MTPKQIIPILIVVLPSVAIAGAPKIGPQAGNVAPVSIQGSYVGIKAISQLVREHESDRGAHFIKFTPRDSSQVPEALKEHECDVGLVLDSLTSGAGKDFHSQYEAFPLGRFVVHVAVNAKTPIHTITLEELRAVFRGKITLWKDVNNAGTAGRIELYAPLRTAPESSIFQKKVMRGSPYAKELLDRSATPRRQKLSAAEVIGAIAKQSNAIGFFLHDPGEQLDKRVRVLRIAKDKDSEAVPPSVASVADGSYPLADTFTLYLHPNAPPEAKEFCEFATGPKAAKMVRQFGVWPEHGLEKVRGQQRLVEVKNGNGTGIVVCDLTGYEGAMKDLSTEFVKAKTAVQLKFQREETRDTAIEKLAKGATELLLADGPIAEGERGTQGGHPHPGPLPKGEGKGTASPQSPRSIELGRMAVGIIVHPENPLESLPMDEAKSIFCGEVKKWPAVRGAAAAMHVFGLKHTDSTTQLLKEKLVERGRSLKYNTQPDNEKVILAVARDPAAIGFVDMSQLPPNDKSVKLVPVFEGKSKSQTPNPLSRTLTLYVSPNASQTAKDFADFLTPEHCKEVIAQYNLLPPLHVEETKLAKTTPARERPQIDLASANEPIPLLLDDPDAPQGQVKPKKLAVKSKPVIPTPEQPVTPKPVPDAQPAPETESEPQPTQTHPGAPSLTDEQIVWLVGGIAGVVLLALGVGWLQAPHRKRKRR